MSIDRVNLANKYVQGTGTSTTNANSSYVETPDFNRTLSGIVSGNSVDNNLLNMLEDSQESKSKITTGAELEEIFKKAADTYDVPEELLKAMAKAESGFNPNAVSKCGAMGVMQLMPATAKSLGVTDAFDPEQNIMGGASYISQKLKNYDGDITLALAAYNAGSGSVAKYGGVPPFKETQSYIKKIYGYMGEDMNIPDQKLENGSDYLKNATEQLMGVQTYSEMDTEKAFYTAQLEIIKHQMDMQNIFAQGQSSEDDEDDENFDLNQLIDSLNRL